MSKSRHHPRFFITALDELLSLALANYLRVRLGVKILLLAKTTPAPRDQDTVFHYGGRPWKKPPSAKYRLVIYQSGWKSNERRFWRSRGADKFLSLDVSTQVFHQFFKNLFTS